MGGNGDHDRAVGRLTQLPSTAMRRLLSILAVVCAGVLVACGSARDEARDGLVNQLVNDGGLSRSVAECVVDGFFEDRTTDELREFFERDELTEAERAEFVRLGQACNG